MQDHTHIPGTDGEAVRTVIKAAIVSYLDSLGDNAPNANDLADRIGCAVEELLAAGSPPASVPEGDEV